MLSATKRARVHKYPQKSPNFRRILFVKAFEVLSEREKEIIKLRKLSENPLKLEDLSKKYKISRERVRQIEEKALEKLQKEISNIR